MGKIVYKRYQIRLHKKDYDILVPYCMPQNLWLDPRGYIYKQADFSELFGDRHAMKCLRNAFITLAQEKEKIIYLPLENKCALHEQVLINRVPELVLYNHNIQLKRKEWKNLLKIIRRYRKPEIYVVYFNFPELEKQYDLMLHQWKKKNSYYISDQVKEYFEQNIVFFECDKRNDLQVAIKLEKYLRCDLEQMAIRRGYDAPVFVGPYTNSWGYLSFYFVTERFIKDYIQ